MCWACSLAGNETGLLAEALHGPGGIGPGHENAGSDRPGENGAGSAGGTVSVALPVTLVASDIATLLSGYRWNDAQGLSQVVSFSFSEAAVPGQQLPFSAAQRASARAAVQAWGEVSGLNFVEIADPGSANRVDIRFGLEPLASGTAGTGGYARDGTIRINIDQVNNALAPGGSWFNVLLHEVGHALGFKHPFDNTPVLDATRDHRGYTVMSYTSVSGFLADRLGPLDIAAAQALYGTQGAEEARGVSATWNAARNAVEIQGGPGADVLRGTSGDDIIIGGAGNDAINPMEGNATIFAGEGRDTITLRDSYFADAASVIVRGGDGDDVVTTGIYSQNGDRNRLFGEAGNDSLTGERGRDWINGGLGTNTVSGSFGVDTLAVDGARRSATLTKTVQFTTTDNGDSITSYRGTVTRVGEVTNFDTIENFAFVDGRSVLATNDPIAQVSRLYNAALGRAPDAYGLNDWGAKLAAGLADLTDLARGFINSAEFQARFGNLDNGAFVDRSYQNMLGRGPDAGGRAFWVDQLATGRQDRAQVMIGFSESPENKSRTAAALSNGIWDQDENAASVARLYQATLNRRPDEGGLISWTAEMAAGRSLYDITPGFIGSAEFTARFGNPGNGGFVDLLYANVLGRAADAGGRAFWLTQLDGGAMDRPAVVLGFSESLEFRLSTMGWIEGGIVFA